MLLVFRICLPELIEDLNLLEPGSVPKDISVLPKFEGMVNIHT